MLRSIRNFSSSARRADIAKITLVGRIGQEPVRQTGASSGTPYLRYPLAVNTGKDETSWFNVTVFDTSAIEFMTKFLKPGTLVYVEADASFRAYEDKDGNKRQSLNLVQSIISPVGWRSKKPEDEDSAE